MEIIIFLTRWVYTVKKREGLLVLGELVAVVLCAAGFASGWLDSFGHDDTLVCSDIDPVPHRCYYINGWELRDKEMAIFGALGYV